MITNIILILWAAAGLATVDDVTKTDATATSQGSQEAAPDDTEVQSVQSETNDASQASWRLREQGLSKQS